MGTAFPATALDRSVVNLLVILPIHGKRRRGTEFHRIRVGEYRIVYEVRAGVLMVAG